MSGDHTHEAGAYVLGALSPEEHRDYEAHLTGCAECRAEVADLEMLPALLGRLDAATAEAIAAHGMETTFGADAPEWADPTAWGGPTARPGGSTEGGSTEDTDAPAEAAGAERRDPLAPRVLDRPGGSGTAPGGSGDLALTGALSRVRAGRRRRRWQAVGGALATAMLAVVAVLGIRAAGFGEPAYTAMTEVAANTPVVASLALEDFTGGTRVRMECEYKNHGDNGKWMFKLVAVPKVGDVEELGWWSARFGDKYDLTGATKYKRSDLSRFELRKSDNTPLLALTL